VREGHAGRSLTRPVTRADQAPTIAAQTALAPPKKSAGQLGEEQCVVGRIDDARERSATCRARKAITFEAARVNRGSSASKKDYLCAAAWTGGSPRICLDICRFPTHDCLMGHQTLAAPPAGSALVIRDALQE
jgi:hypothetical protein